MAKSIEQTVNLPLVYFGDIAKTPYGSKSPKTILDYSLRNTEFLLQKGATSIVIACNSASSVATEKINDIFKIPVFEVISPAVTLAASTTRTGRIGIIGTKATIHTDIYRQQLLSTNKDFNIFSQSCPLLVPLVEEGWTSKKETKMIVRRYLRPLRDKQIDTLILGCTHYPLLKDIIQQKIGRKVSIIDSSTAVSDFLKKHLVRSPGNLERKQSITENRYYVSDITKTASTMATKILGRDVKLVVKREI